MGNRRGKKTGTGKQMRQVSVYAAGKERKPKQDVWS